MNESAAILLRDFANTLDVECSTDALDSPAAFAAWLDGQGLEPSGGFGAALALREALRAAMAAHHDGGEGDHEALDRALRPYPLRVGFGADGPGLVPAGSDGTAWIAAALMTARADGTWQRLKICPAETCRWAFLDTSKNRSRTWCDMKLCGNRTKTRAYRARRTQ